MNSYYKVNNMRFHPIFLIISFILIFGIEGCNWYDNNQVVISGGRTEVGEKKLDISLQDSVLVYGKVKRADDNVTPEVNARIWARPSGFETYSNDSGYYELKLPPDILTIYCERQFGNREDLGVLNNLELLPNEKVELDFYLRVKVE